MFSSILKQTRLVLSEQTPPPWQEGVYARTQILATCMCIMAFDIGEATLCQGHDTTLGSW